MYDPCSCVSTSAAPENAGSKVGLLGLVEDCSMFEAASFKVVLAMFWPTLESLDGHLHEG